MVREAKLKRSSDQRLRKYYQIKIRKYFGSALGKRWATKVTPESGDVLLLTASEAAWMIKRCEQCSHLPS